jgi:actin-like ATPase involved in cell morphogenesis
MEDSQKGEPTVEDMNHVPGIGVDVGTSRIVCCRSDGEGTPTVAGDLNAFIDLPRVPAIQNSLRQRQVPFLTGRDNLMVCGKWSLTFAELFHSELRRPMQSGVISPEETSALEVMGSIFERLIGPANATSERLTFSVPSPSVESSELPSQSQLTNHESLLTALFGRLGYKATAVKEGETLIYAECGNTQYSGIGISFGAGLCNVSMSYLAVPILDFSIPRGGDFIDSSAAAVLAEKSSRVRTVKEKAFSFLTPSEEPVLRAVRVFYEELIETVVEKLVQVFRLSPDLPRLSEPIPMILAGGTALPQGFASAFSAAVNQGKLPLQISEVRMARDPLNAVARGALEYCRVNSFSE